MIYNLSYYTKISIFLLITFILFSGISLIDVAYAMEPGEASDYYGNTEFTSKDPYGDLHTGGHQSYITPETYWASSQDTDTYAFHNSPYDVPKTSHLKIVKGDGQPQVIEQNIKPFFFWNRDWFKRRSFWYLWKGHTNQYGSYSEYKSHWDPKIRWRREIVRDVKADFKRFSKK